MDPADIVRRFLADIEAQRWDAAALYLADDFAARQVPSQALDKPTFLAAQRALLAAIPDWSYNFTLDSAEGEAVVGSVAIVDAHARDFDPAAFGFPNADPAPATGKRI